MAMYELSDRQWEYREFRIQQLKRQAEELTGGQLMATGSGEGPLDLEEQFWESVVAFEQAEQRVLFDQLVERGVSLPAPETLADEDLTGKLWEVIHQLAQVGTCLHHTNHLSDRALYTQLWSESLREMTLLLRDAPTFTHHLDLIGSGSAEDTRIYLHYYADEAERAWWATEWSPEPVPAHEPPPFDRDRFLPQGPTGPGRTAR